jgi:hypothetical protein
MNVVAADGKNYNLDPEGISGIDVFFGRVTLCAPGGLKLELSPEGGKTFLKEFDEWRK